MIMADEAASHALIVGAFMGKPTETGQVPLEWRSTAS